MSIMGDDVIVINSLVDQGQHLGQLSSLCSRFRSVTHCPLSLSFYFMCHPFDGFHWMYLSACSRVDVGVCKDQKKCGSDCQL